MKTCWFIVNPSLFILLMCALPGTGLSQSTSPRNETELLKQMEYNWLMAEFKQDTATIAQMMDDNFMSIGPAGISGKQQELAGMYANMGKRLKAGHVVDSLYLDDVHTSGFMTAQQWLPLFQLPKAGWGRHFLKIAGRGCTMCGSGVTGNGRQYPRR